MGLKPRPVVFPAASPLPALTAQGPTLVVFLRHVGCTFCREALSDIARVRPAIASTGAALAFVHLATADEAGPWLRGAGLHDVLHVPDPDRAHFRAFDLATASVADLLRPRVWARGAVCALAHGFGVQPGDAVRQLPGVFVVQGDLVLAQYRHRSPADRPDYLALLAAANSGVTMP